MAAVNFLPLRSTVIYTSAGTLVPDTYLYTVSSSIPTWTNTVAASTLGLSTLTLANTAVSLGLSTNSTTVGFSQGNYAAGYWSTATGVSASTIKRVNMSASGQYQTIVNQSTNNLYYSNNSGSTWSTLSGVVGPITDAGLSATSQNMIVGTASTNVYVSNNYASTFTAKNLGAPFGYFQFENNLNDTMGNMTLTNYGSAVTYVAEQVGTNAVRLTNTLGAAPLQYLRAPWNAPSAFTISGWFNAASVSSTYQIITMAYTNSVAAFINSSDGKLALRLPTGSGSNSNLYYSPSAIVAGSWYSFTLIYQANGLCSAYMNNILLGSFMNSGGFGTFTNTGLISFGIDDNNSASTSSFNGSLDDIRIFPYAVSPVGPNLYFPFENSTADVVGGSTVTVVGTPTYVAGLSTGSAITLTNTAGGIATQYMKVAWNIPSSFTITGWFKSPSIGADNYQGVFTQSSTGSSNLRMTIMASSHPNPNRLYVELPTGSGTGGFNFFSTALSANTWYNFTVIFQTNGLCAAYLNNVLFGSGLNSGGFGTTVMTGLIAFGADSTVGNNSAFNGSLDDIRIYNTANLYPTATISKNYPVVAVSGNGAYQLAGTTDGELFLSSDSGSSWTVQPSAKILGSWQSLSLSHTGQYMAATASTTQITPNQTSLAAATWAQNGVTWKASASTEYSGSYSASNAFNNSTSSGKWSSADNTYNGSYVGSVSTTIQGIGAVLGEWIQIQSNVPLVMSAYSLGAYDIIARIPKTYYIIGSNDGSTWYPLQYCNTTITPFTAAYSSTTNIQLNYTGTQSVAAGQTGSVTTTAYSYTSQTWTYFRMVVTSIGTSLLLVEIGEFLPIFTNGSSISTNYGASWAPGSTSAQAVSVPQYTQTTPNQTSLAAATWTQNGVTWTASASTTYTGFLAYGIFNNNISNTTTSCWASNITYSASGVYTGSVSTTVMGITPAVSGEWFQLQSSVPLVLQSYAYGEQSAISFPKIYYIVGSNDGSTWYPLQYMSMTTHPYSADNSTVQTTYIQMNYTGTQTVTGTQTGSGTSTAYSYTTNAYTYFRVIVTNPFNNNTACISEFLPIFVIPTTTTSTGSVLSNAIVSQSGSGQYAIGLDSNIPLARLTLDNTNADLLGALTPATGAGTVTYSSSVVKVGTHSAFFNNTPGSSTVTTYLNYTVPASLNKPSSLTMSCWVYPTSFGLGNSNISIMSLSDNTNSPQTIYITRTGVVNVWYATTTNTSGTGLSSNAIVPLNAWSHIAVTFSPGVLSLYVNGACSAVAAVSGNLCAFSGNNMTNLVIGSSMGTTDAYLGYIDDVRIYTTALSSLQIANFYSNPAYQSVKVSSSTVTGLSSTAVATVPALTGLTANVIASAVSFTGQYMVLVTAGTSNNVYYSINYGATFTALTIGSSAMVSCAISADGSYINVANATTSYRLNSNATGYTLAIGSGAGAVNQASNAIAIGNGAGAINQSANSIILNASGSALNSVESGFYVAPILTASAASASSSVALLGYGSDSQVVQSSVTVLSNGNVGIGTTSPQNTLHIHNSTADSTRAPDGDPLSGQIVLTNTKSGTSRYSMAIGMDQSLGIGYINVAGNGAYQPLQLQPRGGSLIIPYILWHFNWSAAQNVGVVGSSSIANSIYNSNIPGTYINTPTSGRFTVPHTGVYLCTFDCATLAAASTWILLRIDGTNYNPYTTSIGNYAQATYTEIVYVTAGQVLDWYCSLGGVQQCTSLSYGTGSGKGINFTLIR